MSLGKRAPGAKADAYYCGVCGSFHIGRKGEHDRRAEKASKDAKMLDMFTSKKATPPRVAQEVVAEAMATRELGWLSQRVLRGQREPFSEIVTITPSIAAHILESNPDNRKLKQRLVDTIAADIASGRWALNGEPIIVASDGSLNDGQHRLNAIMQAGKPVQALIVFGVTRDSRYTVDVGSPRTVGDFLGMQGAKYSQEIAAAARVYNLYRRGMYSGGFVVSKAEIRAEYWNNEKAFNAAVADCINQPFTLVAGKAPVVAAHVILHRVNKEAAAFFFAKLITGENLKRGDAILSLRARLLASPNKRMRAWEKLEMILRHWNAWRLGKEVKQYKQQNAHPKLER